MNDWGKLANQLGFKSLVGICEGVCCPQNVSQLCQRVLWKCRVDKVEPQVYVMYVEVVEGCLHQSKPGDWIRLPERCQRDLQRLLVLLGR